MSKPVAVSPFPPSIRLAKEDGTPHDDMLRTFANWYGSLRTPANTVAPPAHTGSTGLPGQIAFDANFVYVCVGKNTWGRAALSFAF